MSRLPPKIAALLAGVPHELKSGKTHEKLYIAGRLVQTFRRSHRSSARGEENALAQVRRAIRALGHATEERRT